MRPFFLSGFSVRVRREEERFVVGCVGQAPDATRVSAHLGPLQMTASSGLGSMKPAGRNTG